MELPEELVKRLITALEENTAVARECINTYKDTKIMQDRYERANWAKDAAFWEEMMRSDLKMEELK